MNQEKTNQNNKLVVYLIATATDPVWDLAREYCLSTELYDRQIMTGPIERNSVKPRSHDELRLSNLYANEQWKMVRAHMERYMMTSPDMRRLCNAYESSAQYRNDLRQLL